MSASPSVPPTIAVTLLVSGPTNLDTDRVSEITGLNPTKIWRKSRAKNPPKSIQHTSWQYTVSIPASDFDEPLLHVLDLVAHCDSELLDFCKSNDAEVIFCVRPMTCLRDIVCAICDPKTIQRIAQLEGQIHFHLDDAYNETDDSDQ